MNPVKSVNHDEMIPLKFHLSQNYPNPFKEKTMIKYCIAYKTRVIITIHNSVGEVIEQLTDEEKKPGTYEIAFDATNCHSRESAPCRQTGRNLLEGTYYFKLEAGDYKSEKEMRLLK